MPSSPTPRASSPKAFSSKAWAILWTAVVLVACWTPGGAVGSDDLNLPGLDKVVHVVLFLFETFLLLRALHGVFPPRALHDGLAPGRIACWKVTALAGGLAILTEVVQLWVPNRDLSLMDLLADSLGILLGWAWYLRGRRNS